MGVKVPEGAEYVLPERVAKALKGAKTFEDFRKARPFRYLHLYAGPQDVLGDAIASEAKKNRLEVEVKAFDRKVDPTVDLSSIEVQASVLAEVQAGECSGFPCGSFSRARHNPQPGMPGPVRNAAHIYGLPGNTPKEQREADKGTLMATQAAWLMKEQVKAFPTSVMCLTQAGHLQTRLKYLRPSSLPPHLPGFRNLSLPVMNAQVSKSTVSASATPIASFTSGSIHADPA